MACQVARDKTAREACQEATSGQLLPLEWLSAHLLLQGPEYQACYSGFAVIQYEQPVGVTSAAKLNSSLRGGEGL